MLTVEQKDRITRYVGSGCAPVCTSFNADTHAFHWDTCSDVEDADFILINRGGMLARAFQNSAQQWVLVKGAGKEDPLTWGLTETSAKRNTAAEVAGCVWMPDNETLSFLPKPLGQPRSYRKVVLRGELFDFKSQGNETFSLIKHGNISPPFAGKPWESREAVKWGLAQLDPSNAPLSPEAALAARTQAVTAAVVAQQAESALEGVWGMF
jgi:hypothetical protein